VLKIRKQYFRFVLCIAMMIHILGTTVFATDTNYNDGKFWRALLIIVVITALVFVILAVVGTIINIIKNISTILLVLCAILFATQIIASFIAAVWVIRTFLFGKLFNLSPTLSLVLAILSIIILLVLVLFFTAVDEDAIATRFLFGLSIVGLLIGLVTSYIFIFQRFFDFSLVLLIVLSVVIPIALNIVLFILCLIAENLDKPRGYYTDEELNEQEKHHPSWM
jgi:hypothetical protein